MIDPEIEEKLRRAAGLIEKATPHPRDTGGATLDELRIICVALADLHDAIKRLAEIQR